MNKKNKFVWGYLLLIPGIGYITLLITVSVVIMFMQSIGFYNFTGTSGFTLIHWKTLFNEVFWDSLLFSLKMGIGSSMISIIICYPLAILLQKAPGKKTLLSLMKIPMFIPGLVASFLIINLIDYHGILNVFLLWIGVIEEPLRLRNDDYGIGALMILIWKNVPFQMIIMYSAIDAIRKDVINAAKNLGATPFQVLYDIIIPITLPSALVAIILVFIRSFYNFAIISTAGPLYPSNISALMYKNAFLFDRWNTSACIGVIMMISSILFISIYTLIGKKLARLH